MDIASLVKVIQQFMGADKPRGMELYQTPPENPKDDIDLIIQLLLEMQQLGIDPTRTPPSPSNPLERDLPSYGPGVM